MKKNYTCYVVSNKPHLFPSIQKSISPEEIKLFDGNGYTSFSKLVNACAETCPTEIVIMMSDKVSPSSEHVQKILTLLDDGYAFVGLYRFAFFAFKKELFRKIGPLDERFVGGGYEDEDYYIRLKESDLAVYLTEEVPYTKTVSSWNYELSKPHFINKWIPHVDPAIKFHNNETKRLIPEEEYNYYWGASIDTKFLPWDQSYITTAKGKKYTKSFKL
jgi:hypothetical protein